ncbi:MAG: YncE family protein [Candidatus Electryoneaceae bacterium]|nr:YncE family protein [Candidatus Electryoneaceae bacterium]
MKRYLFILAIITIFIIGCVNSPMPIHLESMTLPENALLIANYNGGAGTISTIDLESGYVQRDVVGVGNTPNDLAWADGQLFVINSQSHDMNVFMFQQPNKLVWDGIIDLGLKDGRSPQLATVSGAKMYISNFTTNDLTVVDHQNHNVNPRRIAVGLAPAGLSATYGNVYVCNSGFHLDTWAYDDPGIVYVVSTVTDRITDTIEVGVNPQFAALDSDGRVHIVCTGNHVDTPGSVHIVDTHTNDVVQVIEIGGTPGHLAITSNGYGYIAAGGWGDGPGLVFRYEVSTGVILNGPDNPIETGAGATRVIASSDNSVYVSCFSGDRVNKIEGESVVAGYVVGDGPGAMIIIER